MSKYLPKLKKVLVLTPDGIGSTFFQRSLTLFLNFHGIPTKDYHDLANLFSKNINNLVGTLTTATTSTVARASPYRSEKFGENKDNYLKVCSMFFTDIFVVDRCSFESALSYCNTHINDGDLNVYDRESYIDNTVNNPYNIPHDYFIKSLKYFEDFYVWVDTYFPKHKKINYTDLVYNTDETYKKLFNVTSDNKLSLVDYNKFNFLRIRDADISSYSKENLINFITINDYIHYLVKNNLYSDSQRSFFPFKKITLKEKTKNIKNFKYLLSVYNNYPSNHFKKIDEKQIIQRINREQEFWTI